MKKKKKIRRYGSLFANIISTLSNWLYSYILIILLVGAGIYFTIRTRFAERSDSSGGGTEVGQQIYFVLSGFDGFHSIQSWYRKYRRYFHGSMYRWTGSYVLDVADRSLGKCFCFY